MSHVRLSIVTTSSGTMCNRPSKHVKLMSVAQLISTREMCSHLLYFVKHIQRFSNRTRLKIVQYAFGPRLSHSHIQIEAQIT